MLGIVRVWTTEDEQLLQEHSVLLRQRMGIHSISDCIPDQPYGIYNQESKAAALPKITALVKRSRPMPTLMRFPLAVQLIQRLM